MILLWRTKNISWHVWLLLIQWNKNRIMRAVRSQKAWWKCATVATVTELNTTQSIQHLDVRPLARRHYYEAAHAQMLAEKNQKAKELRLQPIVCKHRSPSSPFPHTCAVHACPSSFALLLAPLVKNELPAGSPDSGIYCARKARCRGSSFLYQDVLLLQLPARQDKFQ